jgi:transposase
MIGPTGAVRVMVATKPVDFRKGADGLAALVRESLTADPFSGAVYVFRAKRADGSSWCSGTARVCACSPTTCIHTTAPSASVEGFGTVAVLRAAARSTRRFHRLHCLRGWFDSGIS